MSDRKEIETGMAQALDSGMRWLAIGLLVNTIFYLSVIAGIVFLADWLLR